MKKLRMIFLGMVLVSSLKLMAQPIFDHSTWDQILLLNVTEEGKVDYNGIVRDSPLLIKYFMTLSKNEPTETWSREEKLAYWINAYNAVAIKLIIENYPAKNLKEIDDHWDQKILKIGTKKYSLDDIKYTILRKMNEPRIHFLINCATKSSPWLWNRAYTADNITKALDQRTIKFINNPKHNMIMQDEMKISKIFTWYKRDFTIKGRSLRDFINRYSIVKVTNKTKKSFLAYDWTLNM